MAAPSRLNGRERRVFAVAQRQEAENVTPEMLYTIGTISALGSVQRGLGGIRLVLEGQGQRVARAHEVGGEEDREDDREEDREERVAVEEHLELKDGAKARALGEDVLKDLDEGFVFVEDRLKDMIISGGENIYSPEIERVLAEHPAVMEVAIIGIPDETWGESVKAVVALKPDAVATGEELIAWCRERLAHFKVPREKLSPDEDFFKALGIDSLQTLDLLTKLENHFRVELPDYELQGVTDFRTLAAKIQARL